MVTGNALLTFGERLAHAMDKRPRGAVSIPELARECDVSYQAVKKWLSSTEAKLEARSALKVAALLCVNPLWLIEGIGPMRETERRHESSLITEDQTAQDRASGGHPSQITTLLQAYLGGLDPVLLASAREILHDLVDAKISQADAQTRMDLLMVAQSALSKPTGTG